MVRKRYTEEQIVAVLNEAEAGAKTADLCLKYGMSEATFYNWKAVDYQRKWDCDNPTRARLPRRAPLSRLKGATPTRAATCRRSSVPSSGR